jgi:hypothetical protein
MQNSKKRKEPATTNNEKEPLKSIQGTYDDNKVGEQENPPQGSILKSDKSSEQSPVNNKNEPLKSIEVFEESKELFPSLRILINIGMNVVTSSSVEIDQFGPILVIETNGDFISLLFTNERQMIKNIVKKATRTKIVVQELEGQYLGPIQPRFLCEEDPINPIYYGKNTDSDESKIKLEYFNSNRHALRNEFENRPEFSQNFEYLFESQKSQNSKEFQEFPLQKKTKIDNQ